MAAIVLYISANRILDYSDTHLEREIGTLAQDGMTKVPSRVVHACIMP